MTLTPREIQEKQFHDAFRGYSHEEVDLFIDQVAEAYETLYKENQALQRRVEDLEEKVRNGPVAPQAPAAAAPQVTAVRSESEDMLKRMLVTAQETADKAVANARARAQMLVDEAEIKARRIEEQADAVSSTTLQDAQRRARDMLQTAQTEEAELRDRIEGMKSFERDFRTRLSAFIRSQLELLETKPLISAGSTAPVTSPFFDRSKLLSETIERFGDYGLSRSTETAPAEPAPPAAPEPEPAAAGTHGPGTQPVADWLSEPEDSGPAAASSLDDEPPSWSSEPEPERKRAAEPAEPQEVSVAAPSASASSATDEGQPPKRKSSATETKSIHELFWGED
ncbi:MAG TPA: DivIVA domain-containing protein [Actinomycetota bacterium]|nr:DivIVA domain-containing protein [Actinomycetota bacterium]